MPADRAPSPGLPAAVYSPPTIPGSAYGYSPITQLSPNLARVAVAFPERVQAEELDVSDLDQETAAVVTEAHHAVQGVMQEALAYWKGMLDARNGTKDERAPAEKGGALEIQYLRGFIDGHLAADAKKMDQDHKRPALHYDQRAKQPCSPPSPAAWLDCDDPDDISVHSAGTEVAHLRPHPPHAVLGRAATVVAPYAQDEMDTLEDEGESVTMPTADEPSTRASSIDHAEPADGDDDEGQPLEELARPRSFTPPDPRITPRPARHLRPRSGQLAFTGLPDVPLPEGRDCMSISDDWDPLQRAALLEYDGEVAWVVSEDAAHPATPETLAEALLAMCRPLFQDETPPRPVLPFTKPDGSRPSSIAVIGTKEQIDHLCTTGTWSSSWLCCQVFPNYPRPLRFVCTFGGLRLPYREHHKAKRMIRSCIENSAEVAALFPVNSPKLVRAIDSLEIQYLASGDEDDQDDRWNVVMDPPVEDAERLHVWRLTIAGLRPKDPLRGELTAIRHPFKCNTCGCLTHPRRVCPASAAPGWFGFIPRPSRTKSLWGRNKAPRRLVKIRGVKGEAISLRGTRVRSIVAQKKYKGFAPNFRAPHLYRTQKRAP